MPAPKLLRRGAIKGGAAALALMLTFAPAGTADTVILRSVGSASTNLWPVYIGINKVSKAQLSALVLALQELGDIPAGFEIERLLLPGVTELTD